MVLARLRRFANVLVCSSARAALIFGSVVLIESTARGQTSQQMQAVQSEHLRHWGYSTVSWNPSWKPVTFDQFVQLEQQLMRDPEDIETRIQLLTYYFHNNLRQQRVDSVCWLIEHHPESPILGLDTTWICFNSKIAGEHYKLALNDAADFERVHQLWETVIARSPREPEVIHNAARFFWNNPPDRVKSVELAKRLRQMDPVGHAEVVGSFLAREENRALAQQAFKE